MIEEYICQHNYQINYPSREKKRGLLLVYIISVCNQAHGHYFLTLLHKQIINWQMEIKDLKDRLEISSSSAANSAKKLREGYIQKLDVLEDQVKRYVYIYIFFFVTC